MSTAPALPGIRSLAPFRSVEPPPAQRVPSEPVGRRTHALQAEQGAITSAWTGTSLACRAWPRHLEHRFSVPRSPRPRVLATSCAARTAAMSRTSRGAGALGPEAPAERQEEAVGRDGRANRLSARARVRAAVLESWARAHPGTEARSGWRVARSEHVILSPRRSASAEQCAARVQVDRRTRRQIGLRSVLALAEAHPVQKTRGAQRGRLSG